MHTVFARASMSPFFPFAASYLEYIFRNACMSFYGRTSQVTQAEDETFEVVLNEESVGVMFASLVTYMEK